MTPEQQKAIAIATARAKAQGNAMGGLGQSAKPRNPFVGMPDDQARATIAALPEGQREAAMNAWADAYVAKEREQGGIGMAIDDAGRAMARGTVVGSWLDEANAVTQGIGSALSGGSYQQGYDETAAYNRARDRAFDEANPWTSTGLQVAGGVANAVAAAPAIAGRATSLGGQVLRGAAAGTGAGAFYGAGLGEGDISNRAFEGAKGAVLGGVLGGATPVVARGVGNLVDYGARKLAGTPSDLAGFNRGSVRTLADIVRNSELDKPGVARRLNELGPDAMVADLSRPLEDQAGAIAATQMPGSGVIVNAVGERNKGASQRVTQAVDRALGGKTNVPKLMQSLKDRFGAIAKPLYDQFRATPVPFTREVEDVLNVLKNEPGILKDARRYANLDGALGSGGPKQFFADIADDGTVSVIRVPNATEWDYIKRALDGRAYGQGVTENDKRIFSGLSRMVKDTVDQALSPGAPEQSVWARARAVASNEFELTDALEAGKAAFSRNLSPDEMAAEMAGMSQAQREAYRIGARQSIRSTMENAATKFGENADTAGMRQLGSIAAREKVDQISPGASQELGRALDAEARFASTYQNVLQNSRTASRQAAQQSLPAGARPGRTGGDLRNSSLSGWAIEGVYRAFNALRAGAQREAAEREVADLARMLVAQGNDANQIVRALIDYNNSLGSAKMGGEAFARIIKAFGEGARQPVIAGDGQGREAR